MQDYFESVTGLARCILRGFALALDLERDFFTPLVAPDHMLAALRLLHYPPQVAHHDADELSSAIGCGAHTDYGCLTVLWQDEVGGAC